MENNNFVNPYFNRLPVQRLDARSLSPSHSRHSNEYRGTSNDMNRSDGMSHAYSFTAKPVIPFEHHATVPSHHHSAMPAAAYSSLPSRLTGQSHFSQLNNRSVNPIDQFNEQYQMLQQARMQQQMRTHTEAMAKQQQTFAMRQKLNPPLSRQASMVNLNQANAQTQTSSSVNCSPIVNQPPPFAPNSASAQSSPRHQPVPMKPKHLQLHQENQKLLDALKKSRQTRQQQASERSDGSQSPVHQVLDFKESSVSSTSSSPTKLLKSPQTKRQPNDSVTFSGWLYKQGLDGLRMWRRRWFVLSDYVLFYYKDPEERELLGTILLPSYRLSECLPHEMKTYRKFSFKLEHKNMRTYYLASENADYMRRWMQVIRAATLMQNFAEQYDQVERFEFNPSVSDQWMINSNQNYPLTMSQSAANPFLNYDEEGFERQPLYANAPPKPRRSNNDFDYLAAEAQAAQHRNDFVGAEHLPRTHRLFGEYEEIYNAQREQGGGGGSNSHSNQNPFETSNSYGSSEHIIDPVEMAYQQPKAMPPRPRSADFLEYESKKQMRKMAALHSAQDQFKTPRPMTRPKSSLDINSSMDNYYYSEASYAAKMRQSAMYIQNRSLGRPNHEEIARNTLRYENERKRLTSEFQNYTANNPLSCNTLPSKFNHFSTDDTKSKDIYGVYDRSLSFANCNEISASQSSSFKYPFGEAQSSPTTPERHMGGDKSSVHTTAKSLSKMSLNIDDGSRMDENIWRPDISAGALLSKTYEELILLLIQLRRQTDVKERMIERGMQEIQAIQQRLSSSNEATSTRLDLMSKMEVLREKVNKIEKQYEKDRPLVNLVDNMVKLGALYRTESNRYNVNTVSSCDNINRLHTNQRIQEQRSVADDRQRWIKVNPHQIELNQKVQQLYELDQILQDESDNLHMLQQEKADIEGALGEIKRKFSSDRMQPESFMATKKLQHTLETELSKIHHQLAVNSKKLENTVTGNSQLERELLTLRQKLQASRSGKEASSRFAYGDEFSTDDIDNELRKVQHLVGDMHRQRQELSQAVNQLTHSTNPFLQLDKSMSSNDAFNISAAANKRPSSRWTETDLDSMHSKNFSKMMENSGEISDASQTSNYSQATTEPTLSANEFEFSPYQDRPEIKTVRIVKRESERRQRDKDKAVVSIDNTFFDQLEELRSAREVNDYLNSYTNDARIVSMNENDSFTSDDQMCQPSISKESKVKIRAGKGNSRVESALKNISSDLKANGVNIDQYRQETARQMFGESSSTVQQIEINNHELQSMANEYKRQLPRKKKRHNTAPNSLLNDSYSDYLAIRDSTKHENFRARDDLDMEVTLRTAQPNSNISGPPDIVRSALGQHDECNWQN